MRISDWSSDVCSSDLPGPGGGVGDAGRRQAGALLGFLHGPFGDAAEVAVAVEQGADAVQPVLQDLHLDAAGAALQRGSGLLDGEGHDTFPPFRQENDGEAIHWTAAAAHWQGNRSEEHTSELQSLMRNSYAVFCLKKKKNINQ